METVGGAYESIDPPVPVIHDGIVSPTALARIEAPEATIAAALPHSAHERSSQSRPAEPWWLLNVPVRITPQQIVIILVVIDVTEQMRLPSRLSEPLKIAR